MKSLYEFFSFWLLQISFRQEVEVREEGGTPAIIESIRAGMVIQLKEAIGSKLIQKREEELVRYVA